MENNICVVCKKPIEESISVLTEMGHVHPGECLKYVESMPINESVESLNEVEILL